MQCNLTTTGTVATVTIDILNNALEKFTWAEILESNDLQTAKVAFQELETAIK